MRSQRKDMSLGRAVAWFVVSYGLAVGGYLVSNAAAGRLLGPELFGYFATALILINVMGQLGLVGVHRSGLREAARIEGDSPEEIGHLRAGVRSITWISLPLSGALTGALVWVLLAEQDEPTRVAVSIAVALLVVLSGLQKLWANYLRGFGHVRLSSLLEGRSGGAIAAVLQAGALLFVWQVTPSWGLAGALAAMAVGFVPPVLGAWLVVHVRWRKVPVEGGLLKNLRTVVSRDWRFASVQAATLLNTSVEMWIAALLLSSIDTSMLGAAQRFSMLMVLPMTALQVVLAPSISRLSAAGQRERMERVLRTSATLATAATVVMWLPIVVAPETVLRVLYGPGFSAAAVPLVLLTGAMLFNAAMGLAGLTLSMSHREGVAATVQWATLVVRVAVGTVAAATLGVTALAVSAAVISVAMYVTMWVRTRQELHVNTALTARPNLALVREPAG